MPLISIIIPTFNRASVLPYAIQSVIKQTLGIWELIIVDDGSTDHTQEVAEKYNENNKIAYIYQENLGVSAARNTGACNAAGEWLVFLDSDDELSLTALDDFNIAIKSNREMDFWQAGTRRIGNQEKAETIPSREFPKAKLAGSFCLRKEVFKDIGGYDERLRFSENSELFHRLEIKGNKGGLVEKITLNYHESAGGGSRNLKNMIDSLSLILIKHSDTLSPHVKHLYHQVIGVNYMRFGNFGNAKRHLLKAVAYKPYKIGTIARLCVALLPPLAIKLYPREVKL